MNALSLALAAPRLAPRPAPAPSREPIRDEVDRDADVLAALAASDVRRALTLLMRRHGDGVHHYCTRMVGAASADDVHQRVFVDAYRGLPAFDGRSSVRTWLYAVARNRCFDELRGRRRRAARESSDDDEVAAVADPCADPSATVDELRALAALGECIERLAPATRDAVLLRYQEGLPYDELAIRFGEQAGTIGRRVARALLVLRTCVERKLGRSGGSR